MPSDNRNLRHIGDWSRVHKDDPMEPDLTDAIAEEGKDVIHKARTWMLVALDPDAPSNDPAFHTVGTIDYGADDPLLLSQGLLDACIRSYFEGCIPEAMTNRAIRLLTALGLKKRIEETLLQFVTDDDYRNMRERGQRNGNH